MQSRKYLIKVKKQYLEIDSESYLLNVEPPPLILSLCPNQQKIKYSNSIFIEFLLKVFSILIVHDLIFNRNGQ